MIARPPAAPALAMMALAGCNLMKLGPKPDEGVTPAVYNANSDRPGRVIEPKHSAAERRSSPGRCATRRSTPRLGRRPTSRWSRPRPGAPCRPTACGSG